MNDFDIARILRDTRIIATVGFSATPGKTAYDVPKYLIDHGYNVIPVNPTVDRIMNLTTFPDLTNVPEQVDVVQIFRPAEEVPEIVEKAIEIGARVVWMQPGTGNPAAAAKALEAGLAVVMDRCMRTEHRRLIAQ